MSKADKMFENLGYTKYEYEFCRELIYRKKHYYIKFDLIEKAVSKGNEIMDIPEKISMQELQAINEKVKELGWNENTIN